MGQSEKHVEKSKSPAYEQTQLALITTENMAAQAMPGYRMLWQPKQEQVLAATWSLI